MLAFLFFTNWPGRRIVFYSVLSLSIKKIESAEGHFKPHTHITFCACNGQTITKQQQLAQAASLGKSRCREREKMLKAVFTGEKDKIFPKKKM